MDRLSRREFLARAMMAGAGATLVEPALLPRFPSPLAQQDPPSSLEPDVDPGFVAGRVLHVQEQGGLVTVEDLDGPVRVLRVGSESAVWKRAAWNAHHIDQGDCLYARGDLVEPDVLSVEKLWANIESFPARIKATFSDRILVQLADGSQKTVHLFERSEIQATHGLSRGDPSDLAPPDEVQIIAFRETGQEDLVASLILPLSSTATTSEADEDYDMPAPDDPGGDTGGCWYSYVGLTTWFCCGNVAGCGACSGQSNEGYCEAGCRSNRLHAAWPKIRRGDTGATCGPYCGDCCIGSGFPRLRCRKRLNVGNPCNGKNTDVVVKDCGPTVRCTTATGCKNRKKIKFDLTPCAFSAIGNLDRGVINCNALVELPC